jgi:hypothetical protein
MVSLAQHCEYTKTTELHTLQDEFYSMSTLLKSIKIETADCSCNFKTIHSFPIVNLIFKMNIEKMGFNLKIVLIDTIIIVLLSV